MTTALFILVGSAKATKPSQGSPMSNKFFQLTQRYEKSFFDHFPEEGLFWGRKDIPLDKFRNYSLEAVKNWQNQEDNFLISLSKIEPSDLNASEKLTYKLLKETLENKKAVRVCKEELWDVNPAWGWHNILTLVATKQPIGTPELRDFAIKRWEFTPTLVQQQIANLKEGLALGYSAPKPAVERVITQLKLITNGNIDDSPFLDFAIRDKDPGFTTKVKEIIKTKINPPLQEYITFLEKNYLPYARTSIGVSALPNGLLCYQAKIKQQTTVDRTPKEIHALGLKYIEKLNSEVGTIGTKKYQTSEMAEVFKRAKEESTGDFSTEKDILSYNAAALQKVKSKVHKWFDLMPKTPGVIKPYPAHRAQTGASGEYNPPSEDGSVPGIFYINTYEPNKRSRIDQEATLYHELIPGHHFQVALQMEDRNIPRLNNYLWNSGYGEGWALYVERLADEMGVYDDEISRLGMLSNESLRASRLVVDTGIHAFNWTRQQAVDYLTQHTALSPSIIEGEVDRYIMLPGQATSYMLGKLEIENLRQKAKEKLGNQFDIRQFHNQILKNGVVTLPMLQQQVDAWLAAQ